MGIVRHAALAGALDFVCGLSACEASSGNEAMLLNARSAAPSRLKSAAITFDR